jgi:hypothetical protein
MKGKIVIPEFYKKRHDDKTGNSARSKILLEGISNTYNMRIEYTNKPNFNDVDFTLVYAVPYHNRPEIPPGFFNTKPNKKIIGYFEDLQCWDNKECKRNKLKMFERYDVLIGSYNEKFKEWYPQFVDKYIFYPDYFTPLKRFSSLKPNPNPIMKCLLSGAVNKYYPFREYIFRNINRRILERRKKNILFADYPKFLNSYFCAIATGSSVSIPVAKYFEIPAAATLLLAERLKDLDLIGMKPGVHYVEINRENVKEKIRIVLKNPKKFIKIRDRATKLVRENHSEINRIKEFENVLKFIGVR